MVPMFDQHLRAGTCEDVIPNALYLKTTLILHLHTTVLLTNLDDTILRLFAKVISVLESFPF